jgi:YVTN family beta-propeller protein
VLDPATDKIVADISTGASPHYVEHADGTEYGVATLQGPGELLLFDPATDKSVRSIAVGKQPHWAALSGDGKTAYVTNEGSNDVSVVDLESGKTKTIAVGHAPRKIVVQQEDKQAATGAAKSVAIANFAFGPAELIIKPGERVTWRNDDGAPHALVFADGSPSSPSLSPGASFTRSFDKPGVYEYACSFHPYMTGRVIVAAANS